MFTLFSASLMIPKGVTEPLGNPKYLNKSDSEAKLSGRDSMSSLICFVLKK